MFCIGERSRLLGLVPGIPELPEGPCQLPVCAYPCSDCDLLGESCNLEPRTFPNGCPACPVLLGCGDLNEP